MLTLAMEHGIVDASLLNIDPSALMCYGPLSVLQTPSAHQITSAHQIPYPVKYFTRQTLQLKTC